jgi:hypothetical protein
VGVTLGGGDVRLEEAAMFGPRLAHSLSVPLHRQDPMLREIPILDSLDDSI